MEYPDTRHSPSLPIGGIVSTGLLVLKRGLNRMRTYWPWGTGGGCGIPSTGPPGSILPSGFNVVERADEVVLADGLFR